MKAFIIFCLTQLLILFCYAQKMELKELTDLLDLPANKLSNVVQKKGFRKNGFITRDEASLIFQRTNKDGSLTQYLWLDAENNYVYETNSENEFASLRKDIKDAGFTSPKDDSSTIQKLVYQKQVFTIETFSRTEDSTIYYVLKASRKELPKKKDLLFAEDLLILNSHAYLSEMFGSDQVKKDVFYYAEDDSSICSILFPNTSREAIIVWKDEVNLRDISFILIGGSLHSQKINVEAQGFNAWRSRLGPYCGMSLQELERLNQQPINFFNWNTESPGYLTPKNKGSIDFAHISIVLSCMNCGFIKVSQAGIIDSALALEEMQKVYVTSLIILPGRE